MAFLFAQTLQKGEWNKNKVGHVLFPLSTIHNIIQSAAHAEWASFIRVKFHTQDWRMASLASPETLVPKLEIQSMSTASADSPERTLQQIVTHCRQVGIESFFSLMKITSILDFAHHLTATRQDRR
jgi:hypothetical protein